MRLLNGRDCPERHAGTQAQRIRGSTDTVSTGNSLAIWASCQPRLVRYIRSWFGSTRSPVGDEEDLTQGVMKSVYKAIATGRFPHICTYDELWRVVRKFARRRLNSECRKKIFLKARGENAFVRPRCLRRGAFGRALMRAIL
jgi:ECF sigma factor